MSRSSTEANAFVSAHLQEATALGERLADLIDQPDEYLAELTRGLEGLVEPSYQQLVTRLCPETPARFMVRGALADAVAAPVKQALAEGSSMFALQLAHRLADADHRDLRLYAIEPLRRALPEDPEMSWQIMRRMGRAAEDWIATDTLADVWAQGVLAEDFRWAELEQLLYSRHTFERRLVPATLATLPHRVPKPERDDLRPDTAERALELLRQLMGDDEVMVQKALSWAIREWTPVDPQAVRAFLRAEADIAVEARDGHRAWVVRDTLSRQPDDVAAELRSELDGIRRSAKAPPTSIASTHAAAFEAALDASNRAVAAQGDRYTRSRT